MIVDSRRGDDVTIHRDRTKETKIQRHDTQTQISAHVCNGGVRNIRKQKGVEPPETTSPSNSSQYTIWILPHDVFPGLVQEQHPDGERKRDENILYLDAPGQEDVLEEWYV